MPQGSQVVSSERVHETTQAAMPLVLDVPVCQAVSAASCLQQTRLWAAGALETAHQLAMRLMLC